MAFRWVNGTWHNLSWAQTGFPAELCSPVTLKRCFTYQRSIGHLALPRSRQVRYELMEPFRDETWTLGTGRLTLSPMVQADAWDLYGILRDPALYQFTGNGPPASADDVRERIRLLQGRRSPEGDELWLNWTVSLRSSGQVVGYFQASVREKSASLAWVIGTPFQNRGYATEAGRRVVAWIRENLEIAHLWAAIHPNHKASCRVASSIGLRPSGEVTDEGEQLWTSRQE